MQVEVHVICCNDSIEYAVIGDEERAEEKLNELRTEYFEKNKWNFRDANEYRTRCYWHIHTVKGETAMKEEVQIHIVEKPQ